MTFFILEKKRLLQIQDLCLLESFFPLFYKYWDIHGKRETEYTPLQVSILTSNLYLLLKFDWDKNGWDTDELKCIYYALDVGCKDLNPNYFIGKEFAYLDHVKTWYHFQEHD